MYRRLQKLFHHGYVNRIGTNPNASLVYSLGPRGGEVLEVSVRTDPGDRYIQHQLMIGDFRISLGRAARPRGIEVMWRQFATKFPVQPDGFFSLRFPDRPEGANRAFFCLEVDRSTMSSSRFVAKLLAYEAWHAAGGHSKAWGIKAFRVLTVTKSPQRLRSLLAAAAESRLADFRAACLFGYLGSEPVAGRVLEEIWRNAARPEMVLSILPTPR
jgi:hypothetical protein